MVDEAAIATSLVHCEALTVVAATMFRPSAARSVVRALNASQPAFRRNTTPFRSQLCTLSRRPQNVATKPLALQLLRTSFSDKRGPMDTIDTKAEKEIGTHKLPVDPNVSSATSIHPVLGEVGLQESGEKETEMLSGVKSDMVGNRGDHTRKEALGTNRLTANHP